MPKKISPDFQNFGEIKNNSMTKTKEIWKQFLISFYFKKSSKKHCTIMRN